MPPWGSFLLQDWLKPWLRQSIDIASVLILTYLLLLIIGERRTLWIVRGIIILVLGTIISKELGLNLLSFVLEKLVLGSAVAMAVNFQLEFRRFLERLGRGEWTRLFQPPRSSSLKTESVIDELVDAVKDLSQNRLGALIVIETHSPIDQPNIAVPGTFLDAEISKELIQSIFQKKTLLHDGAMVIRNGRIARAGAILPLSERTAPSQFGTRHRAAMGITERVEDCLCIVVSEETGSIALAEKGLLNRPLTALELKDLLNKKISPIIENDSGSGGLGPLRLPWHYLAPFFWKRSLPRPPSSSQEKK